MEKVSTTAGLAGSSLPVLPYDADAARWHAEQRARLVTAGRTPPFADGQVAAVAAVNGLTVVTRNTADVEGFDVDVTSWRR